MRTKFKPHAWKAQPEERAAAARAPPGPWEMPGQGAGCSSLTYGPLRLAAQSEAVGTGSGWGPPSLQCTRAAAHDCYPRSHSITTSDLSIT